MQCFSCGGDADMEVLMMVNGKIKKVEICMDCYRKQMKEMMDLLKDENGNINPEQAQKKMFEFFKDNKDEFSKFIEDAMGGDFTLDDLKAENIEFADFKSPSIDKFIEDMDGQSIIDFMSPKKESPSGNDSNVYYSDASKSDIHIREVENLKKAVNEKRIQLSNSLNKEDYIQAANLRDEMREMNKKIMIIREFEMEGEI